MPYPKCSQSLVFLNNLDCQLIGVSPSKFCDDGYHFHYNRQYFLNHREFLYPKEHVAEQASYRVIVKCPFYGGGHVVAYYGLGAWLKFTNVADVSKILLLQVHKIFIVISFNVIKVLNFSENTKQNML